MRHLPILALSLALLTGCTNGTPEGANGSGQPAPAAHAPITTPEVHDAICGHALPAVGHCGNYVKLGDDFVELVHPSLGTMDYCAAGAKGAHVEIAGEMKDGKFVATSYRRVD